LAQSTLAINPVSWYIIQQDRLLGQVKDQIHPITPKLGETLNKQNLSQTRTINKVKGLGET
jgi:hypothetical protein